MRSSAPPPCICFQRSRPLALARNSQILGRSRISAEKQRLKVLKHRESCHLWNLYRRDIRWCWTLLAGLWGRQLKISRSIRHLISHHHLHMQWADCACIHYVPLSQALSGDSLRRPCCPARTNSPASLPVVDPNAPAADSHPTLLFPHSMLANPASLLAIAGISVVCFRGTAMRTPLADSLETAS
jgi:hypothetical protein